MHGCHVSGEGPARLKPMLCAGDMASYMSDGFNSQSLDFTSVEPGDWWLPPMQQVVEAAVPHFRCGLAQMGYHSFV